MGRLKDQIPGFEYLMVNLTKLDLSQNKNATHKNMQHTMVPPVWLRAQPEKEGKRKKNKHIQVSQQETKYLRKSRNLQEFEE